MSDSVGPHRRQPTRLPHPWESQEARLCVGGLGRWAPNGPVWLLRPQASGSTIVGPSGRGLTLPADSQTIPPQLQKSLSTLAPQMTRLPIQPLVMLSVFVPVPTVTFTTSLRVAEPFRPSFMLLKQLK